jgi:hypothetical protein
LQCWQIQQKALEAELADIELDADRLKPARKRNVGKPGIPPLEAA